MVEIDRRDDGDGGMLDDIGRVIAASHADFQNQRVGLGARKGEHGDAGGDFKKRDGLAIIDAFTFIKQRREISLVYVGTFGMTRQTDAFVKAHEMRRCIGMNTVAARFEDGPQIGPDRTFSIGARDVKRRRQRAMRRTERVEQAQDTLKRQVDKLGV